MRTVVLVPRRADNGRRDVLWHRVRAHWGQTDWPLFEGHHDDGPFNRSLAINRASAEAGDWDAAIIADGDCLIGADAVQRAIKRAVRHDQISFPHDKFHYLTRRGTDKILAGYVGNWRPYIEWTMRDTCSQCVVVTRSLWEQCRGFDERFVGWGMEDIGFSITATALGGGLQRGTDEVWHLWHPLSPENDPTSPLWQRNVGLMQQYIAARDTGGAPAIRALVDAR